MCCVFFNVLCYVSRPLIHLFLQMLKYALPYKCNCIIISNTFTFLLTLKNRPIRWRTLYLNDPRVQERNPDILFFSLKSPSKRTPSRFPNRARLEGIMLISQEPHLSGSPVKQPSLTSPSWNPSQRDKPPLEPSFIHLSKSPV